MRRIAIIGAGLSGRLLALNLLRSASSDEDVVIQMFDRGDEHHMGPAYSSDEDHLLLNVPADRMGAFPDEPGHFLAWCRDNGLRAGEHDFLPRRLYRDYMLTLMREALGTRPDNMAFEHICGDVVDIEAGDGVARIHVEGAGSFPADWAVLALGNFPPRHPPCEDRSVLESERYVRNPWEPGVLDALSTRDTVFLIGTGQTTVDIAVALHKRSHEGRVIALSRRGLLPLSHRGFESYESFSGEIRPSEKLLDIFRTVRRHLRRSESIGSGPRAVIDSLRPDTQAIWAGLSEHEKRRFLRHVFRYWEIVRSRIPPESGAVIAAMRASGQLDVVSGRIRAMSASGTAIEVCYVPRGRGAPSVETAALVLNCIGPESDYRRIDDPLVRNLMKRGLIRPGPAHIGIDALPNGMVINTEGVASEVLVTLGSTMKGVLWEVLAVPEIRMQAERLARMLLH